MDIQSLEPWVFFLFPPCGKTTKNRGQLNAFPGAWTRRRQHPKLPETFEAKVEIQKVLPSVGFHGFHGVFMRVPWDFPWDVPWEFHGIFLGVSWVFHGVPWELHGGSWEFQMIHFTSSRLIHRYLQDEWLGILFRGKTSMANSSMAVWLCWFKEGSRFVVF